MNRLRTVALALGLLVTCAAEAQEQRQGCTGPLCGTGTRPAAPINTLRELHEAFYTCFKWPARGDAHTGMEITIRFSVTRSGEVLGEPRFTFSTANVPADVRAIYQRAVADAFKVCAPFPLTASFGDAVAGRPQAMRFIDTRGQRKA